MRFLLLLLTGCAALDPALEGRRACGQKMFASSIRDAEGFLAIARAEEAAADFFGHAAESRRRLLCAVSALEAADAVVPADPSLRAELSRIQARLKDGR